MKYRVNTKITSLGLGMIYIWRPWKLSSYQDPHPLSIYLPTSSIPLTLDVQFRMTPLSPNDTMHVNEQIKTETEPSHVTFKLTMRSIVRFSHKQYNGVIKG